MVQKAYGLILTEIIIQELKVVKYKKFQPLSRKLFINNFWLFETDVITWKNLELDIKLK